MSLASPASDEPPRGGLPRWALAAIIVLVAHVALGVFLLHRQPVLHGETADAVEVDLSPPDAPAPEAPEIAPPPPSEAQAATPPPPPPPPTSQPDPVPPQPTPPLETVTPPPPPAPLPPPTVETPVPDLPVLPKPDAVLTPQKPDPAEAQAIARQAEAAKEAAAQREAAQEEAARREAERRIEVQREKRREDVRQIEIKKEKQREEQRREEQIHADQARREQIKREAAATQARAAARARTLQRATSAASLGNWQGEVLARINGAKRGLPGGGSGVAVVAFTVDRGGHIAGARLARSSGSPLLDQAAVATVRRAGSVSPPPGGNAVSLTVPIRFNS